MNFRIITLGWKKWKKRRKSFTKNKFGTIMKKILIGAVFIFAVILMAVFGLRFLSGEDNWICRNGEWVKHGNPSAPKPTESCGAKKQEIIVPMVDWMEYKNFALGISFSYPKQWGSVKVVEEAKFPVMKGKLMRFIFSDNAPSLSLKQGVELVAFSGDYEGYYEGEGVYRGEFSITCDEEVRSRVLWGYARESFCKTISIDTEQGIEEFTTVGWGEASGWDFRQIVVGKLHSDIYKGFIFTQFLDLNQLEPDIGKLCTECGGDEWDAFEKKVWDAMQKIRNDQLPENFRQQARVFERVMATFKFIK
jgi:hypothetical protein